MHKERNLYKKKEKEIKEKYRSHFFQFRTIFLYSIVVRATDDDLISRGTEISKKSGHFERRLLDNRLKYARIARPYSSKEIGNSWRTCVLVCQEVCQQLWRQRSISNYPNIRKWNLRKKFQQACKLNRMWNDFDRGNKGVVCWYCETGFQNYFHKIFEHTEVYIFDKIATAYNLRMKKKLRLNEFRVFLKYRILLLIKSKMDSNIFPEWENRKIWKVLVWNRYIYISIWKFNNYSTLIYSYK